MWSQEISRFIISGVLSTNVRQPSSPEIGGVFRTVFGSKLATCQSATHFVPICSSSSTNLFSSLNHFSIFIQFEEFPGYIFEYKYFDILTYWG